MTLGDLFEWLAASGLVYGTYSATNRAWVAVVVGALCLGYFAQCYATQPLSKRRKPKPDQSGVQPYRTPVTLHDHVVGTWTRLLILRNRLVARWRKLRTKTPQPVVRPVADPPVAVPSPSDLTLVGAGGVVRGGDTNGG